MAAQAWDDTPDDRWSNRSPDVQGEPGQRLAGVRSILDVERARFFLWAPVCLGSGIAAYFAVPREPSLVMACVPLVIALALLALVGRGTLVSAAVCALVLACGGFAIAKLRVELVRAPVLERNARNAEIAGVVTRVEPRPPRGARLTIAIEEMAGFTTETRPRRVRVRTMSAMPGLAPGDRIRLKATLAPPAKPALPGGFDYARMAWFEGIGAVGYAYAAPVVETNSGEISVAARVNRSIEELRLALRARIVAALPGEQGAIATALITGERGGITASTNDAYKNSGLFHILSISGLHMVVMAGAVFFSVRLVLASVPALALQYAIKKWSAAAGIIAAFGYLAISGGAFATVRSALMIVVIFGAVLLDRPALALRNVALSAFVILTLYPESLFDAGFQMSYAAVTALIAVYEEVRRRAVRRSEPHAVWRVVLFFGGIISSTLIASAAVAPFAAFHFHQSQQYAVLANLVAIPICNLVVMPAALAALCLMPFGLEGLALWPMGLGIGAMTWCAEAVAALPGSVGHLPAISVLAFTLMLCGGMWLALWQTRMRFLGACVVLTGIAIAPFMPRPDVLIARNGELVAVRGADGRLSALPARQSKFELERWLENDGDGRAAGEAQKADGFSCDGAGCATRVKSLTLAVARHPAAIADDCAKAGIVVLNVPRPKGCDGAGTVIDVFDIWRQGTHAIYVEPGAGGAQPRVRVDTVAAHRGDRPWSHTPERALPKPRMALPAPQRNAGLPSFAARPDLLSALPPRAEIEDDDVGGDTGTTGPNPSPGLDPGSRAPTPDGGGTPDAPAADAEQ